MKVPGDKNDANALTFCPDWVINILAPCSCGVAVQKSDFTWGLNNLN